MTFRIPNDPEKRENWLQALNGQECSSSQFLCQHHFQESDFITTNSAFKLKQNSVPTEFSQNVSHSEADEVPDEKSVESNENDSLRADIDYWKDQAELLLLKVEMLMKEKEELKNELIMLKSNEITKTSEKSKVLHCLQNGIVKRDGYPEVVRKFCLSMHFHSPAGYSFLREFFNKTIPDSATIRNWYANSDITGENGLSEYCLNILKKKVAEKAAQGQKLVVALLFDEMSIKKHIRFTDRGLIGYENYIDINPAEAKPASNAIVYMVSAINDNFQLPIAHYFITTLDADQKVMGLRKVATAIIETGAILTSVTFDGLNTNPCMCNKLGANLDVHSKDFKPYMDINGHRIFIMYDPSHMQKLVRNILAEKQILYDADGHAIKWDYIKKLVVCQINKNLTTHKMNLNHLNWKSNIMNVELAVQTLSNSVTDSLTFLAKTNNSFRNAVWTAKYTKIFNDSFDAFNSKMNKHKDNPLKRPICAENKRIIFDLFERAMKYILGLQTREAKGESLTNLCTTRSKTGFQGYVVSMRSTMAMYQKFVVEDKVLDCLPMMAFSQDYLEIFFGRIRAINGECDNPTTQMFHSAYRKLLANTTVLYSKAGNCRVRDSLSVCNPYSNILTVSSKRTAAPSAFKNFFGNTEATPEEFSELKTKAESIELLERKKRLTGDMQDLSSSYCAKIIEKKISGSEHFNCEYCRTVFDENSKLPNTKSLSNASPCRSTYDICRKADHFLKLQLFKDKFNPFVMCGAILFELDIERLYSKSDFIHHADHKLFMIKFIIQEYVRMKGTYLAKKTSNELISERIRRKFRKLIHFKNE